MKFTLSNLILFTGWVLALPFTGSAQEQNIAKRFYFGFDSGATWQQPITVKEKDSLSGSITREKARFDTGLRLDVAGGYQFTDCLAAKLEGGLIFNAVRGNSGNTRFNSEVDDVLHVPFFLNLVGRVPTHTRLKPFIGAGVGGMYTSLESVGYYFSTSTVDTDLVFAYQGSAGLRYEISRKVELGLAYKYTGTLGHTFDRLSTTTSGDQVHSVLASVLIRW